MRHLDIVMVHFFFVCTLQLDCVGGSAGCYGYRPKIVQCRNVGFDGYDVQVIMNFTLTQNL